MFGETRQQPTGLADLLLWFGLVDDGVVLQRDGSLLAAWQYRGPDLQSATHSEMAAIARRLNRILRLGSGWMIQVDSFRSFSSGYSPRVPSPIMSPLSSTGSGESSSCWREITSRTNTSWH